MKTTILVIEDEPAIQQLIEVNLRLAGYEVEQALNVNEARELINHKLPDVILLDWMLPGTSGINYAKELRSESRTQQIPLIMLTAKGAEQDKVTGLQVGADDYVTKPFSPKELCARIQAVLRRRAPQLSHDAITLGALMLDPTTHRVQANGQVIHLGPTEFRMLHFFMAHPERVFSRAQLLDKLWGDHVFIEERTVDVHIRRLRRALAPTGHDKHVQTVRGAGYRFSHKP